MARPHYSMILPQLTILTLLTLSFSSSTIHANNENDQEFARTLNPKKFFGLKKQKLSHFKFYFHDIYSGPNPTAVEIVKSPTNNSLGFGFVSMIDDPLTLGPSLNSKLVGRAQGLYGLASQEDASGLLMAVNLVFVEGKYNGSTLSILGRNHVFSKVREMPIVGGSGLFRFATGYVHASNYGSSKTEGDVVEYNAYVLHY